MMLSELYKNTLEEPYRWREYLWTMYDENIVDSCGVLFSCIHYVINGYTYSTPSHHLSVIALIRQDLQMMSQDELWEFLDKLPLEVVLKRYEVI